MGNTLPVALPAAAHAVAEADLRLLASVLGTSSVAGQALAEASGMFAPRFYRYGRKLLVMEAAQEDTIVLRPIW